MKIAIIPARGGSKRIPQKNIKSFLGKPILTYSVDAAINCGLFDVVMVSTDCEEIEKIALQYGAQVPFKRSEKNSDDYATTADVIKEVLDKYAEQKIYYDYACCLYPTAPFATGEKLRNGMRELLASGADALVPVVRYSFPPQRGFLIREDRLQYQFPEFRSARSQDLEAIYHDCGQFYMFNVGAFMKEAQLVMKNTIPFFVPESEAQDIDSLEDWSLAEMKYRLIHGE